MLCWRKTISFDKAACVKSTRHVQTLFDISVKETNFLFEAANTFVNDSSGELLTGWKSHFATEESEPTSRLKPTIGFLSSCGLGNKLKKKKSKTDIYGNLKCMISSQTNDYIPLNGVYQNQKEIKMTQKRRRLLIPVNKPSLHQRFLKIAENTYSNQSSPNLLIFKRKFGGILSDFNKLNLKNESVTPPLNSNLKKLHINRCHASMHVVNVHVKPRINVTTFKNIRKSSGSKNRLYWNINDRLKKIDPNNFKKIDATIGDYIVPQMKYENFKFTTDTRKLPSCAQSFNKKLKEKIDTMSETIQVKGISYRFP